MMFLVVMSVSAERRSRLALSRVLILAASFLPAFPPSMQVLRGSCELLRWIPTDFYTNKREDNHSIVLPFQHILPFSAGAHIVYV